MQNKEIVMKEYDDLNSLYRRFACEIEHLLQRILMEEGINCTAITSRVKERESLSEKIDRKEDKYQSLSEITDIAGVRIITYYIDDIDKVTEIIEREFVVDRENSIDKGKSLEPDRFGYCSVHYVVEMCKERLALRENKAFEGLKCEIQIRSVLQHAWAEIEHDLGYKSELTIPKEVRRSFSRLAGLLELGDKEFKDIRDSLVKYKNQIVDKLSTNEIQGVEIDAVSLETFIDSNRDIVELSNKIREFFGWGLREKKYPGALERAVGELTWVGVFTIDDLQQCVLRNKDYAAKIAKKKSEQNKRSLGAVDNTIAIFYLCYAELLSSDCSEERVVKYYKDNEICSSERERKSGAKELLAIRDTLQSQN